MENGSLEQEFASLYRKWFVSIVSHDADSLDKIQADEFVYTNIDGKFIDKAQYLSLIHMVRQDSTFNLSGLSVRSYGDFALVFGQYVVEGGFVDGKDASSFTRFTSAWIKRDGRWQSLTHHATRQAE